MELATRRPSVRRDKSQHATAMWVAFERVLEQEDEQLNVKRKVTKTPYIKVTPNLTGSDNDRAIVRMAGQTFPGMAHWASSGPTGKTCGVCVHWSGPCAKFRVLTNEQGPKVPMSAAACKHFEDKPRW
jgi:hypothetical protein